jgi:hypothetical protein
MGGDLTLLSSANRLSVQNIRYRTLKNGDAEPLLVVIVQSPLMFKAILALVFLAMDCGWCSANDGKEPLNLRHQSCRSTFPWRFPIFNRTMRGLRGSLFLLQPTLVRK